MKNLSLLILTLKVNFYGPINLFESFHKSKVLSSNAKLLFVSSNLGKFSIFKKHKTVQSILSQYRQKDFTLEKLMNLSIMYVEEMKSSKTAKLWPASSYRVSKVFLTIAVFLLSKLYPGYGMLSMCPGWCRTDLGGAHAKKSAEEGAIDLLKGFKKMDMKQQLNGDMVFEGQLFDITD